MREAVVLAGGFGTRLKSVVDVPKPIAPVRGRAFLGWLLDRLSHCGFTHVVLATGYRAECVQEAIGSAWRGMRISYSIETTPLGTGGAVAQASNLIVANGCHVMNGDTYLHYDPAALEALVEASDASVGVVLAKVDDVSRYGAIDLDGKWVDRFSEKHGAGPGLINAGCYFFTGTALEDLRSLARPFALETGFLVGLAATKRMVALPGAEHFIDIGIPDDYVRAAQVIP